MLLSEADPNELLPEVDPPTLAHAVNIDDIKVLGNLSLSTKDCFNNFS